MQMHQLMAINTTAVSGSKPVTFLKVANGFEGSVAWKPGEEIN
jgi:hypothetical protein